MSDLRMPAINDVQLAGRLTASPDLKYLPSGAAVSKFSVAINNYYKKDGERHEETHFVDVQCWNKMAEGLINLPKGCPVYIKGSLKQESWEGKDGKQFSKLLVNAFTVSPLVWTEKGGVKSEVTPTTSPAHDDDDIPF